VTLSSVTSPAAGAGVPWEGCKALALEASAGCDPSRFVRALVAWFARHGIRPAVLHCCPDLDLGDAGKDTEKFRRAGANPVALAAPGLRQITYTLPEDAESRLFRLRQFLAPHVDLVLVEGAAPGSLPRVVLLDPGASPRLWESPEVLALVCPKAVKAAVPVFRPHQTAELGRYLMSRLFGGIERTKDDGA